MRSPRSSAVLLIALLSGTSTGLVHRGSGRFFLDTADTAEYKTFLPTGVFHGVTTNPVILQRSGVPCNVEAIRALATECFELGGAEFMAQAWGGDDVDKLVETGVALNSIDPSRMTVKVPVTKAGVEAARRLAAPPHNVRICLTACYASAQALIAAGAGVEYLAPYLGRMSDNGKDGMAEVKRMELIARGTGSGCRILVASLRSVAQLEELAAAGLDTFTFGPDIARALFDASDGLTEAAAEQFEEAAAASAAVPAA